MADSRAKMRAYKKVRQKATTMASRLVQTSDCLMACAMDPCSELPMSESQMDSMKTVTKTEMMMEPRMGQTTELTKAY